MEARYWLVMPVHVISRLRNWPSSSAAICRSDSRPKQKRGGSSDEVKDEEEREGEEEDEDIDEGDEGGDEEGEAEEDEKVEVKRCERWERHDGEVGREAEGGGERSSSGWGCGERVW